MLRLLVTQRVNTDRHKEPNDAIEHTIIRYFRSMGVLLYPVSNFHNDTETYLEGINYDGLILSGGGDVNLRFINIKTERSFNYSPEREKVENYLIETVAAQGLPILGICHGMQQLNCYYGGMITADIHSGSTGARRPRLNHSITIEKKLFGLEGIFSINHYHDHGIRRSQVAEPFDIFAVDSEYDVIEGIVHRNLPILGINWHPERRSPDGELNRTIIKGFFHI